MRFTTVFLTGALAAIATAQATTTTSAQTPEDSAQAAILKCLEACEDGDVSCTSKCIAVPNPNEDQVNETTECAAKCPQGNGTEAETKKYADCVQGCIGKYYFTATGTPAQATGGASSGGNGGNGGNGGDSNSEGGDDSKPSGTQGGAGASGSGTAATGSPSPTGNGAAALTTVGGTLVAGFVAAVLAL